MNDDNQFLDQFLDPSKNETKRSWLWKIEVSLCYFTFILNYEEMCD